MSQDDDGLLSRWSRRKRAVAEEEKALEDADPPAKDEPEPSLPPEHEGETEEATLARLGLPSPESLEPGDDFSVFMQSGVPEYLRRRALRRLWRSNPVLANLDGLNDYDEDFTAPEETMKILKSAYQIGRGFLRDEKPAESQEDAGTEGEAATPEDTESVAAEEPAVSTDQVAEADVSEAESSPDTGSEVSEETASFKPRRMRFKA